MTCARSSRALARTYARRDARPRRSLGEQPATGGRLRRRRGGAGASRVRTGAAVSRIVIEGGRARGVLVDGETVRRRRGAARRRRLDGRSWPRPSASGCRWSRRGQMLALSTCAAPDHPRRARRRRLPRAAAVGRASHRRHRRARGLPARGDARRPRRPHRRGDRARARASAALLGHPHLVRLPPWAPDGLPVLGPWPDVAGLFVATAHYRNGILLAPITAALLTRWIVDGDTPASITPFLPERFDTTTRHGAPRRSPDERRGLTANRSQRPMTTKNDLKDSVCQAIDRRAERDHRPRRAHPPPARARLQGVQDRAAGRGDARPSSGSRRRAASRSPACGPRRAGARGRPDLRAARRARRAGGGRPSDRRSRDRRRARLRPQRPGGGPARRRDGPAATRKRLRASRRPRGVLRGARPRSTATSSGACSRPARDASSSSAASPSCSASATSTTSISP